MPTLPVINDYDHEASRWGLTQAIIGTLLHVAIGTALVTLYQFWTDNDPADLTEVGTWLLPFTFVPPIVVGFSVWRVGDRLGQGAAADFQARVESSDVGFGAFTAIVAVFAAGIAANVSDALFGLGPDKAAAVDAAQGSLGSDGVGLGLVLFAIGAATIVPLSEELLFRGLFWSALEKRGVAPWTTNVITSFVFSAWHVEPSRLLVLFTIALFLGHTRMRTGRIGAAVVCHVLINALGMTAVLVDAA